jgi:Domain of unknown function (DUF4266)
MSSMQRTQRLGWLAALVLMGSASSACVAPYERETLARRDMTAKNAALTAGEEHALAYREGSSGGGDAKGGGCGCN